MRSARTVLAQIVMGTKAVTFAIVLSLAGGCASGRNAGSKTALGAGVGLLVTGALVALPSDNWGDCTHGDSYCASHDNISDGGDTELAAVLAGAGLATLLLAAVTYDPTPEPEPIYVMPPPPPPVYAPPQQPHPPPPPPPVTINCTVCIFNP